MRPAPIASLLLLCALPGTTTSFAPTRPASNGSRSGAPLAVSASAPDEEATTDCDTDTRTLLLDEIEDLTRSFETVQRTISINKEVYEERVGALTARLEDAVRERDELRDEVERMRRGTAEEGVKWSKERESLSKARDALKKQVIDAKADSIRERDELRAKMEKMERELDRLGGDSERDVLIREKNDLIDEAVKNKMSFTSEKSRLQADFGAILREKDMQMNELRQKIDAYEEERSSLRKLTVLGMKRFASFFRLGKKENK